jgi:hypothetical protein
LRFAPNSLHEVWSRFRNRYKATGSSRLEIRPEGGPNAVMRTAANPAGRPENLRAVHEKEKPTERIEHAEKQRPSASVAL